MHANMQVMKNGGIIQSGNYGDLLDSCSDFLALVTAHHSSREALGVQGHQAQNTENSPATTDLPKTPSINSKSSNGNSDTIAAAPSKEAGSSKIIQEEEKESGQVSWNVYKLYITQAWGWWGVLLILAISLLSEVSRMASNYWLSYETSGGAIFDISMFLGVYVSIVTASVLLEFISILVIAFLGLKSAQAFFSKMFNSILRSPMSFFDTTPSGRILSRVCLIKL
jgi:ATP-binding cassette subfamily C (CFTR/MRP) protein 1